jgi:hypothetical protein
MTRSGFPTLAVLATALLLLVPARGTAQRLPPAYLRDTTTSPDPRDGGRRDTAARAPAPVGGMIVGGLAGGTIGFFAGGYAGFALDGGNRVCGDDPCGVEGALWGVVLGESVVLPLGVHIANGRRGNYGTELLTSVGIAVGGVMLAAASDSGIPLLLVPIAQIASGIAIEKRVPDRQ